MKLPVAAVAVVLLLAGCSHRPGIATVRAPAPEEGDRMLQAEERPTTSRNRPRSAVEDPGSRHPTGHYPTGGYVPTTAGQDLGPRPSRG